MTDCLFCKIIQGAIPTKKVYEDAHTFAFEDINPQAPTHFLIVPKKHVAGLKEAQVEDAELIGRLHLVAAELGIPVDVPQKSASPAPITIMRIPLP